MAKIRSSFGSAAPAVETALRSPAVDVSQDYIHLVQEGGGALIRLFSLYLYDTYGRYNFARAVMNYVRP